MREIEFIPFQELKSDHPPSPAKKHIPYWYRSIPIFVDERKGFELLGPDTTTNTLKFCSPFLDCLTSGYYIFTENDIWVNDESSEEYKDRFLWKHNLTQVGTHGEEQISPDQVPYGYSSTPFKFISRWGIKTPPGYSALITHPINYTNNEFMVLSGIVDTDNYNLPVNLPFFIKKDFSGIIEAGTPIAQVIPFKRESWSSTIANYDKEKNEKNMYKFNKKIYRSYKKYFWSRKKFD